MIEELMDEVLSEMLIDIEKYTEVKTVIFNGLHKPIEYKVKFDFDRMMNDFMEKLKFKCYTVIEECSAVIGLLDDYQEEMLEEV